MDSNLINEFFNDLKTYNNKNFKDLCTLNIEDNSFSLYKAFSSVITRYFIFLEHHEDVSKQDARMLYYKLKIDMIATYFSEYPDVDFDLLRPFQTALKEYVESQKEYKRIEQFNENINTEKLVNTDITDKDIQNSQKLITKAVLGQEALNENSQYASA